MEEESIWWRQCLAAAGRDDQTLWREREGRELANEGGGQLRNPVDISTGQGAVEGGKRRGAKTAVQV